ASALGEGVADETAGLEGVVAVVAVVDLAREAAVRAHPRDHGGALEDGVGAAAEVPAQRDVDRDGVDAVDPQAPLMNHRRWLRARRKNRPCDRWPSVVQYQHAQPGRQRAPLSR